MFPFTRLLFLVLLILSFLPGRLLADAADQNDRDQIAVTFNNFLTALLAKNGKGIVDNFSTKSAQYYVREKSPTFTPDPYSSNPTVDLVVNRALTTKLSVITDQSPTLDAFLQNIFAKGNGPIPASVPLQISNIVVNGDTATATLTINGTEAPFQIYFVREGGRWKIDPMGLLQYFQLFLTFDQARKGRTTDLEVQFWVDRLPAISPEDVTAPSAVPPSPPPAPGVPPAPTSLPTSTPNQSGSNATPAP